MEFLVLAGLAGAGYVLTMTPVKDFKKDDTDMVDKYRRLNRDNEEVGISWGNQRTKDLEMADLNEAYKPRSAPRQEDTRQITDIFRDQSDISAYLEQYGSSFYLRHNGEMPLGSAQQSNLNVEIPSTSSSFRGDPGNSLLYYPRVYCDFDDTAKGRQNRQFVCSNRNFYGAGQPTESEECLVPEEGRNNINMNPYGPGGQVQRLVAARNERDTRRYGADRSRIGRPPANRAPFCG